MWATIARRLFVTDTNDGRHEYLDLLVHLYIVVSSRISLRHVPSAAVQGSVLPSQGTVSHSSHYGYRYKTTKNT